MGNSCPKCEPEIKNESVISISDNCIYRLTNDKGKSSSKKDDTPQSDEEWIAHLKCLDEIHSLDQGISVLVAEKLMDQVQEEIGFIRGQICLTDKVIACLKRHHTCPIKCKHSIDEFIDCINKSRIEIIKEKVEEEEKCRLLEEKGLLDGQDVTIEQETNS